MLKRPNNPESEEHFDGGENELETSAVGVVSETNSQHPSVADQLDSDLDEEDIEDEDSEDESEDDEDGDEIVWFDRDTKAFLISLGVHVVLLVGLAAFPIYEAVKDSPMLMLSAVPRVEEPEEFRLVDEIAFSEEPTEEIGANSLGNSGMAAALAPTMAEISDIPTPVIERPADFALTDASYQVQQVVGLVQSNQVSKGLTGVGATGTDGAVDRVTYEILQMMEERPTLVVWLFDQSGSLHERKKEIRERFNRIYEELGIVQQTDETLKGKEDDPRLLTSVVAFGDNVNLITPKPLAELGEIQKAIDSIEVDTTGNEKVFTALYLAAEQYKHFRSTRSRKEPERNVMMIVVTDERGDDAEGLESTIKLYRQFAMPVYVIGSPAPFGREFTYIRYIDPDPQFDQTPTWAQVDQGPESIFPERVQIGFDNNYFEEPVIDSGFGPFALSRLCYETGGIYFTVHPNRKYDGRVRESEIGAYASRMEYFFDPERMFQYRPEYISKDEYMQRVAKSPLRQSLIKAAQFARVGDFDPTQLRFIKSDEARFITELTTAQQSAARLEPKLSSLAEILIAGMPAREKESNIRWLAGFDLSVGMTLAHKVRTEGYNAMLAKAKRGMKFEKEKSNTWVLVPDAEISVGSKAEKEAQQARDMLESVVKNHPRTPWALLASRELKQPLGWKWVEEYTDLTPPAAMRNNPNNNNNIPPPPQDDQAAMLAKPPPKRPVPKL
ncbi:MAG: VWA domain-containing protein [Planctomycetaceae bacterium]|nr:VWA domain-containing protein [Planctomycetaceae bacterium]MBN8602098.1 VWA domain-containing protein [Planctomycetota bacterium]